MHVEKYGNHEFVIDIFHFYFLNIDISLTIYIIRILDLGPSFHCMAQYGLLFVFFCNTIFYIL